MPALYSLFQDVDTLSCPKGSTQVAKNPSQLMEPLLDSLGHSQSQTANSTLETALHTVLLNRHAYPISICTLYMYIYDHIIDIYM